MPGTCSGIFSGLLLTLFCEDVVLHPVVNNDVSILRVVEFASKEDMKAALKKLDDTELNGKRIRLKIVRP